LITTTVAYPILVDCASDVDVTVYAPAAYISDHTDHASDHTDHACDPACGAYSDAACGDAACGACASMASDTAVALCSNTPYGQNIQTRVFI
jgi:hypothetical protein